MNPSNSQYALQVYGSDASYRESPTEDQTANGVVPLDTLPASWWNHLWYDITRNNNFSKLAIDNIRKEILSVLTDAGITPTETQTNQLLNAIIKIHRRTPYIDSATSDLIPGSVISSADRSSVSVNQTTGKMTVNALSDYTSTSTVQEQLDSVQEQVDSVQEQLDSEETAREGKDVSSVRTALSGNTLTTTITSSDGTTHLDTSETVSTVAISKSGNQLGVSVNGIASQTTVAAVSSVSLSRSGNNLYVSVNDVSSATVNPINSVICSVDTGGVLRVTVNGVQSNGVQFPMHATSATYLRPSGSSSTLVTADGSGNLKAHTLELT